MGSIPYDYYCNIKDRLEQNPESISWTQPRNVCILKGITGKCGLKVKVYQGQASNETYSIITRVKEECLLKHSHFLSDYDRIISINNIDIRTYLEECVLHMLLRTNHPVVELQVCQIDRKRDRESSGSESEMSSKNTKKPGHSRDVGPPENVVSPEIVPDTTFPKQVSESEVNIHSVPVINSPEEVIYPPSCISVDTPRSQACQKWNQKPDDTKTYIKYPHCVKWSLPTAISLEKGNKTTFGFKFKIKKCVYRQDDWYTLVDEVRDVPALGKLMVGDYIRSIDGQALENPQEAFKMMDCLEKCTSARIVLQRPEGLISNFKGKIQIPKELNTAKPTVITPNVYEPNSRKPMRQNSSGSQRSSGSGKLGPVEQSPKLTPIEQKVPLMCPKTDLGKLGPRAKTSDSNTLSLGLFHVRPGSSCSFSNESHMNLLQNEKLVDNSEVHLIVQETPALNNNNPVKSEFHVNQTVKLPKIRIFICGTEARSLAKLLVPVSFLSSDSTSSHNLYECVRCTMDMSKAGDVSFRPWSSYENLLRSEETTRLNASNDSLANSDKQKEDDYLHRGVVNAEIFIVSDEKFFQYGCNYLFTRTSLFLLTFNGAKLLSSAAGEILRLKNMIHCIRCCVGYDCNVLTYGLLSGEQTDFKDEVQTLFYTSYGQQIRKYNVSIPDLILTSHEDDSYLVTSQALKKNVWRAISETIQKQPVSILTVAMMAQFETLRQDGKQILSEDEFTKLFKSVLPSWEPSLQHVVWTTLKEFGEILSSKAAPMNIPNNQQMEKLLFIDPEIILQHIQTLVCIPQKYSSNSDITKHWIKLVATGNISHEDIINIINSVNADKILNLLLAFGMIFKHFVDQDGVEQYFFPYFLSEQGNANSQKTTTCGACLYLQFVDQTHMSSMQFYQLAFNMNSQTDSNKISVTSAVSCTIHHQGHEITLIHHKFEDRMQIIIDRSERNKRLRHIYTWICDVCNTYLPPEIQYVIGPECPLHGDCRSRSSLNSLHVLDISSTCSIMCKSTRLDNHKAVKRWLSDPGSEPKTYITDLPFHIFQKLYTYLQCSTTLGQDWRGLGGLLGLSLQDIAVYETRTDPAKYLLLDQSQTNRLTVQELIEKLEHPDMQRLDLIELLQNWLEGHNR